MEAKKSWADSYTSKFIEKGSIDKSYFLNSSNWLMINASIIVEVTGL